MLRSRAILVLLVAVGVAAAAGAVVVVTREPAGPTRDSYCDPPPVVSELPPIAAVPPSVSVRYEPIGSVEGAVAVADSGEGRLLVVARDGGLWAVSRGADPQLLLDLGDEISSESLEQGLLGVAVAPDLAHVYLYGTFVGSQAKIIELALANGTVDETTRRDVLVLDDPAPTHNGGRLAFGPDGMLYLGIGDGGDGALTLAAQDPGSPFGKLLRIDPRPSGDQAYSIPPDNPFVGEPGARGEVWALGFRNPWGWSIDRATGDLWVGDVGQLCFEEIDLVADGGRGANLGWSHDEGAHAFEGPILGRGGAPDPDIEPPDQGPRPTDLVGPVLEYPHSDAACSVIGGVVYRGDDVPALRGTYVFADLCRRGIDTLRPDGAGWERSSLAEPPPSGVVAFGEGIDGSLYVVSIESGVHEVTSAL